MGAYLDRIKKNGVTMDYDADIKEKKKKKEEKKKNNGQLLIPVKSVVNKEPINPYQGPRAGNAYQKAFLEASQKKNSSAVPNGKKENNYIYPVNSTVQSQSKIQSPVKIIDFQSGSLNTKPEVKQFYTPGEKIDATKGPRVGEQYQKAFVKQSGEYNQKKLTNRAIEGFQIDKVLGKNGAGNIDLHNRPLYINSDGSYSTLDSIIINENGIQILIPTIAYNKNNKPVKLAEEEAIERYHSTGEFLGKFKNTEDATEYKELLNKAQDFYYNSKYKTTAKANVNSVTLNAYSGYYTDTGFEDINYDYINKNQLAKIRRETNHISWGSAFGGVDNKFLEQMTEDEIAIYNYIYKTDKQAAGKFIESIAGDLNLRKRISDETKAKEEAKKHPVKSSVASVIASPLKTISYVGQVADYIDDGKIDQNAGYNKFSYNSSAVRSQVSETIEKSGKWGKVGSALYGLGMSMGDFVINTAITGGYSPLSLAIMGSGAAADMVISSKDKGLSDNQAMALGTIAGMAEVVFEKMSLDKLFSDDFIKNGLKKYILANATTEGLEEVGTSLTNLFADIIISGDKSEFKKSIEKYKNNGYSKGEAIGLTIGNQALSLGWDFVGGFLSGGVLSGGNAVVNYSKISNIGKSNKKNANSIINYGLKAGENSTAQKNAQQLLEKSDLYKMGDAKKGISNYELGRQVILNEQFTASELGKNNRHNIAKIINLGMKQEKTSDAYTDAIELKKKVDSGKEITDDELGQVIQSIQSEFSKENSFKSNTEISNVIHSLSKIMGGAEVSEDDIQALIHNPVVFEIYTGTQIKENAEAEIRQYLGEKNKKNARANSIISAISDKTGLAFDYDVTLPLNIAGYYDPVNKKIVLNPANDNALDYAVVHELTHFVENKKGYSAYKQSLLNSSVYQDFLVANNYANKNEFRSHMEKLYKEVYSNLSKEDFNEAIDYEMAAKLNEYIINSEPAALKRLANKDTGIKAVFRNIAEFFEEIYHKLNGNSEKAYALKMARKFRELTGINDVANSNETVRYSIEKNSKGYYVKADRQVVFGNTKKEMADNIERYINSLLDQNGHLEIKAMDGSDILITETTAWKIADIKKSVNNKKIEMADEEFAVKVHAGAHIDELLKVSKDQEKYTVDKKEHYYADYWGYRTVFFEDYDGRFYELDLSIGITPEEGNKAYNIGQIKNRTNSVAGSSVHSPDGLTNKVSSANNKITHQPSIVNTNSMQNQRKYSVTKESDTSNSQTFEKPEAQKKTTLISRGDTVFKTEDIRHKSAQKIFKGFSVPVNKRTRIKSLINITLKDDIEKGNNPSEDMNNIIFNLLEKNSKVVDDSVYNQYKDLKELIRATKLHFSEEVRKDFSEAESFRKSNMDTLSLNQNEGRGIDDFYQELCNSYPDVFSDEIINSADQLREISDVAKSISKESMSVLESGEKEGLTKEYFENILKSAYNDHFISYFENEVRKGSDKITNKQKHKYIELISGRPYGDLTELEMNDYDTKINKEIENFRKDKDVDAVEKILNTVDRKSNNIIDTTEYIELFDGTDDIDNYALENFKTVPAQFIKGNQLGMTFDGKDIYRNNDMVSNKSKIVRTWLSNLIERPLEDAKGDYVDRLKSKVNYVYNKIVKDLDIKMGSKESAAVQWYGEGVKPQKKGEPVSYTLDDLKAEFPDKWENIVKADKLLRKMYNDYIDEVNTVLKQIYPNVEKDIEKLQKSIDTLNEKKDSLDKETKKKAEEKIEELKQRIDNLYTNRRLRPRKDYYRHFQEEGNGISSLMNILKTDIQISPDLIKVSENTKPLTKWWGALQHRNGDNNYKADGVGAILNYIPNAEYKINIEPFIGHMRKVINSFIKDTSLTKNANGYIRFLTNWTNDLAGKTNTSDRVVQDKLSRKIMNVVGWVGGRARANAIVGNLRTAVVQIFNLPNATMYIKNPRDWGNGIKTMILDSRTGGNIVNQSVFLKERYLDDIYSKFKKGIKYTPEKLCNFMLTAGDKAATTYIWYSAYSEGVRKKLDNPRLHADRITRRAVAGRGIGELPLMQKSKVIQAIAPFQVEVSNSWEIMKEKGKQGDLFAFLLYSASAWALNSLAEFVFGDKVIPDIVDIISDMVDKFKDDEPIEQNIGQAALRAGGGIMSAMPYASVIASAFIPDEELRNEIFGDDDPSRYGVGVFGLEQITSLAVKGIAGKVEEDDIIDFASSYILPIGGKQIARTYKGYYDISQGGSYTNKGQLRFPITTTSDKARTLMFGAYSTKKGQEYLESLKPLGDKQTKIFKQLINLHNGRKYQDEIFYTFKGYSEYKKKQGKTSLSKKDREKYVNTMSPLSDMPGTEHIREWFINNVDTKTKKE